MHDTETLSERALGEYLEAALSVVAESRAIILAHVARGFEARLKADDSYVTDADLDAERALRAAIGARYPGHGIIGEEFPAVNPDADFQWIIDPIDGTLSFTHGIPLFGTIVALHHRGEPMVGVIDHPALDRCYSAARGLGTHCNGRRLQITDLPADVPLTREIVAICDRAQFQRVQREEAFDALLRSHPYVRVYSDCFGHTLAAGGSVGAVVDFGLRLWDLAATRLLIEEAGGKYVLVQQDGEGQRETLYGIICGKPRVVDWLVPMFARES